MLELLLRILSFYLSASKIRLGMEMAVAPLPSDSLNPNQMDAVIAERERLGSALISAQESAVIQILLEVCLPLESEKVL